MYMAVEGIMGGILGWERGVKMLLGPTIKEKDTYTPVLTHLLDRLPTTDLHLFVEAPD